MDRQSPWCDISIIWARDLADDQSRRLSSRTKTTPGSRSKKFRTRSPSGRAERLDHDGELRVPEENRLQNDQSFRDNGARPENDAIHGRWEATGCAMGAYENALKYCQSGCSSASRSAHSRWCKTSWPKCLPTSPLRSASLVRMSQLEAEGR